MELKETIFALRKQHALTQDEFARRLFVTRQAVSRWETGETAPNLETLRRMAETFSVSVDALLGSPSGLCQSCGMLLQEDRDRGTERHGEASGEYCAFCYQQGAFTQDLSMEEMVEHNLKDLEAWNQAAGLALTEEEARGQLTAFLPTLRRWKRD